MKINVYETEGSTFTKSGNVTNSTITIRAYSKGEAIEIFHRAHRGKYDLDEIKAVFDKSVPRTSNEVTVGRLVKQPLSLIPLR